MAKLLVFVVLIGIFGLCSCKPHELSEHQKIRDECAKEQDIHQEDLPGLHKTHDRKLDCFHGCIWQKNGVIGSDLSVDLDEARKKIAEYFSNEELRNGVTTAIERCHEKLKEETFEDVCELAKNYHECKHDILKELNIDIMKKTDDDDKSDEDKDDE